MEFCSKPLRGPDVMFEIELLWNGWFKKDGAYANLV